jgi:hypothetical protein
MPDLQKYRNLERSALICVPLSNMREITKTPQIEVYQLYSSVFVISRRKREYAFQNSYLRASRSI